MESGIQRLFLADRKRFLGLAAACVFALVLVPSVSVQAQSVAVEPDVVPDRIDEDRFDTEDFELGVFAGVMSIEDFGSDVVAGARLAYHVSEDFFIEASLAQTEAGETSFERLSGDVVLLPDDDRDFRYYSLGLAYQLFRGEAFWDQKTFNTSFYLSAGIGNTDFAGDQWFTSSLGFGYRVVLTDYLLLSLDVRDHIFNTDILGEDKTTHNIQATTGLAFFF